MTHDELLERVSEYISSECDCESCGFINGPYKALRAVVELCRDYSGAYPNASEEFENGLTVAFALVIQAIEKELL